MVLLCGLALAIMVAILEFCWNSRKNAMNDRLIIFEIFKLLIFHVFRQSLCSEMAEELRFAMRCHGSRQKPALRRSCSRCSPEGTYVPAVDTRQLPPAGLDNCQLPAANGDNKMGSSGNGSRNVGFGFSNPYDHNHYDSHHGHHDHLVHRGGYQPSH